MLRITELDLLKEESKRVNRLLYNKVMLKLDSLPIVIGTICLLKKSLNLWGGGGMSLLWFKNYVMKIATCMWKLTTTSPF